MLVEMDYVQLIKAGWEHFCRCREPMLDSAQLLGYRDAAVVPTESDWTKRRWL